MAVKTESRPTVAAMRSAADAAEQAVSARPDTHDWSALAEPVTMQPRTTFSGVKVNVLETVPEPIRQRAEASLTINAERVKAKAKSDAKRARVDYHWSLQRVTDKAMGEAFVKLITKYAKYRPAEGDIPHAGATSPKGQVTARTGDVLHFRKVADDEYVACEPATEGAFTGVRYSVRPFEQRGDTARLPGTT
jgi:hypothetical protein